MPFVFDIAHDQDMVEVDGSASVLACNSPATETVALQSEATRAGPVRLRGRPDFEGNAVTTLFLALLSP